MAKAIKKKAGRFANVGGIIYDEITSMANADLDAVLKARSDADSSKDRDVATQPDMGANTERMRRLLWEILDLDVHLFFVGHRRIDKDNNAVMVVSPDFMPKLNKRLREPMHVVGHSIANVRTTGDKEVVERLVQVHPTRQVVAKTRVGGLDRNVTWEVLTERLISWLGSSEVMLPKEEVPAQDTPVATVESDDFSGIEVD